MPNLKVTSERSTGNTYGRLTILSIKRNESGIPLAHCRCSCGSKVWRGFYGIRHGQTKSCGCLKLEKLRTAIKSKSLANRPSKGTRFGALLVLNGNLFKNNQASCLVKCDCGAIVEMYQKSLERSVTCKPCSQQVSLDKCHIRKRRIATQKAMHLVGKINKNPCSIKCKSELLQEVLKISSTGYKTRTIKSMTIREIEYLIPLDPNTPCIWPWDDFGNPLSDAQIKKAKRLAKQQTERK